MATGTLAEAMEHAKPGQTIVKLSWIASTVSGSFSTAALSDYINDEIGGKYCLFAVTESGTSTSPTDNYDISINDSFDCDIFGSELNNRSSGGTVEQASPKVGNAYMARLVTTPLSFVLANNTITAASGTVRLFFVE